MSAYVCVCVNMKRDWHHCHMSWGSLGWIETKWWNQTLQFLFCLRALTHEHTSLSLSVCPPLSPFLSICLVYPLDWGCVTGLLLLKAPLRSSSAAQWPQRSRCPLSSCAEWHMTSLRGPWSLTGPFRALGVMLRLTWAPDQCLNGRKSLKDIKTSRLSLLEGWWVSNNDGKCFRKLTLILLHDSLECLVVIGQL